LFANLAKKCRGTKVWFAEQIPWVCVALGRQRTQPGKVLGIAQRLTPGGEGTHEIALHKKGGAVQHVMA